MRQTTRQGTRQATRQVTRQATRQVMYMMENAMFSIGILVFLVFDDFVKYFYKICGFGLKVI